MDEFKRWFSDYQYIFVLYCSQNGKFSYGYASSPGKRSSMEDFFEARIDCVDEEIVGLFGVFDGMNLVLVYKWNGPSNVLLVDDVIWNPYQGNQTNI